MWNIKPNLACAYLFLGVRVFVCVYILYAKLSPLNRISDNVLTSKIKCRTRTTQLLPSAYWHLRQLLLRLVRLRTSLKSGANLVDLCVCECLGRHKSFWSSSIAQTHSSRATKIQTFWYKNNQEMPIFTISNFLKRLDHLQVHRTNYEE